MTTRLKLRFWRSEPSDARSSRDKSESITKSIDSNKRDERHGLFVLEDKPAGDTRAIDIVAVHGLNGHYEKTWSVLDDEGQDVNWLRDFLPEQIPNARVMSFGYNSLLQFSKSVADIYTFADQLLEALLSKRITQEEQSRPIMFICHSLGGIVVKQALNRAHERERYHRLLEQFFGIAFFGTPHTGSGVASWSTILSKVLRAASLGTSTNAQLSKDLENNSRVLDKISKSFVERGKRLEIFSFYEVDKMELLNFRVVEESSAVLGWPNETAIAINGDHRSICRFSKINEQNYLPVGYNLPRMALKKRAPKVSRTDLSEEEIKHLNDLHTTDYKSHLDRNPSAISGTCKWVLDHEVYRHWQESQTSSLVWLSADPGCGKSVLMSFLIAHNKQIETASSQKNICYFFFKADNDEQRFPANAMSAILHQIYTAQPGLVRHAKEQLEIPGKNTKSLSTLWEIFVKTIEDPGSNDTICFIDGLDECEQTSARKLTHLISDYFATREDCAYSPPYLKMVIASRPENFIKVAFDKTHLGSKPELGDNYHDELYDPLGEVKDRHRAEVKGISEEEKVTMIRLRGEDETDEISRDIELVVKAAVQDLTNAGLPSEIMSNLQKELIKRADRTFLWTTLIINLLKERSEAGASLRELNEILTSRDIDSIYAGLLEGRSSPHQTRKLLSIILAATRPLTLQELNVALAVVPDHDTCDATSNPRRPGKGTFDDLALDMIYPFENYIKSLCGHFLRVIRGKVYLVHETAREYLLSVRGHHASFTALLPHVQRATLADESDDWDPHISSLNRPVEPIPIPLSRESSGPSKTGIENPSISTTRMQHSFSLKSSHCLLLEICVTYLYFLGKRSQFDQNEIEEHAIGKFLNYAAKSWTSHYHRVFEYIPSRTLPYYHGLCHPLFPGFRLLLKVLDFREEDEPYGLPPDGLQDYYLAAIGVTSAARDSVALSSNPGLFGNHYFPLEIGETGFVSLKRMT